MSTATDNTGTSGSIVLSNLTSDEFANLLQQEFQPKSDNAKTAVEAAIFTLAEQLLIESIIISDDAMKTIEGAEAESYQYSDVTP